MVIIQGVSNDKLLLAHLLLEICSCGLMRISSAKYDKNIIFEIIIMFPVIIGEIAMVNHFGGTSCILASILQESNFFG